MAFNTTPFPTRSDLAAVPLSAESGLLEYLREICDPPCLSNRAEEFLPLLHSALARPNGSNQWAVYVLASLYWRATGSGLRANICALKAAEHAPKQFRDVALISLGANLMRQVNGKTGEVKGPGRCNKLE